MDVIKRRTRYALELMKEGEDCELHMHNNYMIEDLKDKVAALDDWLNGVDGKFNQDNPVHMNALASIVMCYDKLEGVCERVGVE
tara:strand:- start:1791 stop:2042 length:252 start_codon:yes stop_codon:yes gene_type:complete